MSAPDWHKVKDMFALALKQPRERRPDFLSMSCADDSALRAEVESLLEADVPESLFDNDNFGVAALFEAEDEGYEGREFGRYKVVREIGRGGMGAVYLAARADDEYQKQVAVKIIKRGLDTDEVRRRFRNERQILARLEHPNIARLLDGGTTEDGSSYFVMEYVEGQALNEYADGHKLLTAERLELFRTICSAVAYAHQNLVVHRDLKPSNILVTADGTPKLLDFGIAKLLHGDGQPEADPVTMTALRVLTPEYASPEQVRGLPATTATDVYSLGVVLYELLTGHRPHHLRSRSPAEIKRVICEEEPARPSESIADRELRIADSKKISSNPQSTIRNGQSLRGDLDNIVLMAMRKEPARRYSSVAQLSDDVRRHLEGLPVIARKDTFSYRAAKFVRRNRVAVAAAALILISLIGGIVATAWQARAARTQRARAERRFSDVRRLANSFMFEIHDSVQNLPGSTPTRQLLVARALEYLNSLAQESQNDPSLQRELVTAYIRIGNVQGNPNNANLGDRAGAMQSYRQALGIAGQFVAANPTDAQARRSLGVIREKMSDVQAVMGDIAGAVGSAQSSLAAFKTLAEADDPRDNAAQQSLAISYIKMGDVVGNPDFPNNDDQAGSMRNYCSSLALLQSLDKSDPNNPKTRQLLALVYERIGTMHAEEGNVVAARDNYLESQVIRQWLATSYPENTENVRDLAVAHEKMGNVMSAKGNFTAALESRRKALEIFSQLAKADPGNVQVSSP